MENVQDVIINFASDQMFLYFAENKGKIYIVRSADGKSNSSFRFVPKISASSLLNCVQLHIVFVE